MKKGNYGLFRVDVINPDLANELLNLQDQNSSRKVETNNKSRTSQKYLPSSTKLASNLVREELEKELAELRDTDINDKIRDNISINSDDNKSRDPISTGKLLDASHEIRRQSFDCLSKNNDTLSIITTDLELDEESNKSCLENSEIPSISKSKCSDQLSKSGQIEKDAPKFFREAAKREETDVSASTSGQTILEEVFEPGYEISEKGNISK